MFGNVCSGCATRRPFWMTRNRPGRSVRKIRPSGAKTIDHGTSRPVAISVSFAGCSFASDWAAGVAALHPAVRRSKRGAMHETDVNRTGERISVIGYGAMHLSIQNRPPEDQSRKVLHAVLDAGVTLIDTADAYCLDDSEISHNERLIAFVLRERRDRESIHVATKGGIRRPRGAWTNDGSPKHIREACEKSLRALEVEQIWLYQFHAPDPTIPFEKSVETFAQLQRDGKCKHVGVSNVTVAQIGAASRIVPIVSVQNRLNPYFREAIDDGVVAECERLQLTFLAYSPVGGGRLSKKIPSFPIVQEIARKHGVSTHAVTLAWDRAQGKTVVPIPSARTQEHAIDSANSFGLTLTPEEVAAIDDTEFSRA
jgi:aryl-alcohol dehydrogenase-like predicted oxidoreductase